MPHLTSGWETASVVFSIYTTAVALLLPGLERARRRRAIAGSAAALLLLAVALALPNAFLDDWVWPPALLLLGYWSSGALFVAPMPRAERLLVAVDRRLGIPALAGRTPRLLAEFLEFSYAAVYPLIPLALIVRYAYLPDPEPARFWTVVLVTDFVCFGVLPWVQTRPPRAIEPGVPWRSTFRPFNVGMLGAASIQVNTFPSGHAAEAMAAALLTSGAPWPVALAIFTMAFAVSAGAVLGRYHYALDAVAGWVVALGVWVVFVS